jgi:hypothetical protein
MTNADSEKVWSSPLAVSDVPAQGLDVTLVADESVRARLAKANNLAGLASAEADLHVARRGREGLHVTGELRARAAQTCVVTLEPFEAKIVEPVDVEFEPQAPQPAKEPKAGERRGRAPREVEDEEGMDDLNAPDPIVDGKIDLGALAAEFLTLGVDPYPRKPGVAFEERAEEPSRESPFARLAAIAAKAGDNK